MKPVDGLCWLRAPCHARSQHRNNIELKFRERYLMLLTPIVKRLFFSCTLDMLLSESVDAKATTSFTFQEKESSSRP